MNRFTSIICICLLTSCSSSNPTENGAALDLNALPEPAHRAAELHTTEDLDYLVLRNAQINAMTDDGILLVADTYTNRIIAFSQDLDTLSSVGRSGVAPSEFVEITSISLDVNDSLIVLDRRLNRISIHARNGDRRNYIRSEVIKTITDDAFFVEEVFRGDGRSFITVELQLPRVIDQTGKVAALRRIVRTYIGSVVTIHQDRGQEIFKIPTDTGGFHFSTPPFARRMLWAYDSRGYMHIMHWTDHIEITKYSLRGDSISTVSVETKPLPVTSEDLSALADRLSASHLSLVSETRHVVRTFLLSNTGTYWIELETADIEHRAWIELDESGVILKHIVIDYDTRLIQIFDNLIFAQSSTQFGEPMLSVLKIESAN